MGKLILKITIGNITNIVTQFSNTMARTAFLRVLTQTETQISVNAHKGDLIPISFPNEIPYNTKERGPEGASNTVCRVLIVCHELLVFVWMKSSDCGSFRLQLFSTEIRVQSRRWLPAPISGLLWFGVDDSSTTVHFPIYGSAVQVPTAFAGHLLKMISELCCNLIFA